MAKQHPVPWEADPHTKAKHALYKSYLAKWMPIMINGWNANITYAEGFAGPGVYVDGSPGSPVLALRTLLGNPSLRERVLKRGMRFIFVDHDQRAIDRLPEELTRAVSPVLLPDLSQYGVHITIEKGKCEPRLCEVLEREGAWERPILAVLDTFGGAVSFDLVRRIAHNQGSEVVITMKPQYFSRFAGADDLVHGDAVFGGIGWRAVTDVPSDPKERWLLQRYRQSIVAAGFPYVLDFELVDARGESLFLIFGTTHVRGLEKMKEAMWETDDVSGIGYRDPRDPNQETLTIVLEPQTAPLKRLVLAFVAGQPAHRASIHEIRRFALYQTVYKASQAFAVVRDLLSVGLLVRSDDRPGHSKLSFTSIVGMPPT